MRGVSSPIAIDLKLLCNLNYLVSYVNVFMSIPAHECLLVEATAAEATFLWLNSRYGACVKSVTCLENPSVPDLKVSMGNDVAQTKTHYKFVMYN